MVQNYTDYCHTCIAPLLQRCQGVTNGSLHCRNKPAESRITKTNTKRTETTGSYIKLYQHDAQVSHASTDIVLNAQRGHPSRCYLTHNTHCNTTYTIYCLKQNTHNTKQQSTRSESPAATSRLEYMQQSMAISFHCFQAASMIHQHQMNNP